MAGIAQTTRLHTLDYLRGIAALSIMLYHYSSWSFGKYSSEDFLGRVGIYGVSIFYILSGLTLFYVYYENFQGRFGDVKDFFLKRFFRIFPLLWLTIILTILVSRNLPAVDDLLLNLTGLFSVFKWNDYIGTGVWSIGNELCFYLFFPVFIILSKYNRVLFYLFALVIFLIYLYFAYSILIPVESLSKNGWYYYVNPLNQVFLFLCGFLIGLLFSNVTVKRSICIGLLFAALIIFTLYPVTGDRINLIKGDTRIVFTFVSIAICFAFFKLRVQLPSLADNILTKLGEYSYSLYLLHPIVWQGLKLFVKYGKKMGISIGSDFIFIIAVVLSIAISRWTYIYFENFFMAKGKFLTQQRVHSVQ